VSTLRARLLQEATAMSEIDDETLMRDLAEDFGVEEKPAGRSALEQRILAGFEEIERFVEKHGRVPQHGEGRDIFERLYAVRLDRLRQSPECRAVLKGVDTRGLLGETPDATRSASDEPDDAELQASLAELEPGDDDLTKLTHVRSHEDRKAAEEVAQRTPCADFEKFRPTFEKAQRDLNAGVRQTAKFHQNGTLEPGDLFILSGQKVLVAAIGEVMMKDFGREDSRLRVIFDNGTESNLLLRSLQRALHKDERNRRILPPDADAAPLFAGTIAEGDLATGYVYVLRSKSNHPFVAEHRSVLHKIGVTGGDVKSRVANAKKEPTYLLADVEIVATFKLANINRQALEALVHRFFGNVRVDMELKDRFGGKVEPREWFLVPFPAIDEAIQKIKDGTIGGFRYDPETARLAPAT
jgi:hypothetical protein